MMTAEQHDNKRSWLQPRGLSGLRMARPKRCPYNQERPDSDILVILESAYAVVPSLLCFGFDCSIQFCELHRYVPLIWISLTLQYNLIIDAMLCTFSDRCQIDHTDRLWLWSTGRRTFKIRNRISCMRHSKAVAETLMFTRLQLINFHLSLHFV